MKTEKQLLDERLLWLSAEHWLENWTYPENASTSWVKCACCREYFRPGNSRAYRKYFATEIGCPGCPIREHTGRDYCEGTPYYDAETALQDIQEEFPEHAEAMYTLLVELALSLGQGGIDEN